MDETQTMRASDRDRQQVVDRLRGAVEDGRLTMDEYLQRMELAYQAVIYQDLAPLEADLRRRLGQCKGTSSMQRVLWRHRVPRRRGRHGGPACWAS